MNVAAGMQGFVILLWLLTIGLVALVFVRASRGLKVRSVAISALVVGLIAALISAVNTGIVFIEPPERGVVISALSPTGYRSQVLEPGLHLVVPFVEYVKRYPISRQTYTMSIAANEGQVEGDDSITARTSDGQEIIVDASVIYSIDPQKVIPVHINWQDRYTDELVRPQARGIIRDAVSQFKVEEVVTTKRFELTQFIRTELEKKFADNGLQMVDFVLRNITFSPEYAASVEQKQIAEQQAQQAKFVVEQRKQEAQQAIETSHGEAESTKIRADGDAQARLIQAKAEAEALQMIANALKDSPDLLTYQYITKLAPGVQVMLVPNNTPYLLPLPTLAPTAIPTATVP